MRVSRPDRLLRRQLVEVGASIFDRRLTHGGTGNLSVRRGDEMLVTPTGVSLGRLDPAALVRVTLDGAHAPRQRPSKEWFLHAAMYAARSGARAVIHLHSTYSVAVSCLADTSHADALLPLTPYFVMRVGRLPMLPYHAPGDPTLGPLLQDAAKDHHAVLLSNHGPIVAAEDLASALDIVEELEETARLQLLLHGRSVRVLSPSQIQRLRPAP
jgi:ribulose-5-phosphate 4-epimerase/fuculose-1-phosphate aldolase